MKVGLNVVPIRTDLLRDATCQAEELGFESVWIGEHMALPMNPKTPYPYGKPPFSQKTVFLEPFVAIAHLAAVTEKMRFGTGVALLPMRNLFLTAREIVTADWLSKGRLDLGVGIGTIAHEYEVMGYERSNRGERLDEFLDALDVIWREEEPSFSGKHYQFEPIGFEPKPFQKPRAPVYIGGLSDAALARAAKRGDGWYGSAASPEEAQAKVGKIKQMLSANGRDPAQFHFSLILWQLPDKAAARAYEEAGIERIVCTPFSFPDVEQEPLAKMKDFAKFVGLR
jgi:probable F420-dependent oxidoreductase